MRSNKEKIIYKRYSLQLSLNIGPNYNYLHKMIYIYPCKNKKEMRVSAKTVMKQVANNERYKLKAWRYRDLGSAHGIILGFLKGRGCSLAFIAR